MGAFDGGLRRRRRTAHLSAGDIGYYAPTANLVFYYGDVGYWNGIVRIGGFDTTMELIEHQADNFQVTIERS